MRRILLAVAAVGLMAALVLPASASAQSPDAVPDPPAAPQAAPPLLEFDQSQATTFNGPITDADQLRVCGADDGTRFLSELLSGDPLNYQIPYRLADVVAGNAKPTATTGRQMVMSGEVEGDVFGTGDFPFDHPFGSDFNMDVAPDAPYADISQVGGVPTGIDMHTELSEGQLPHTTDVVPGPASGMTWEDNSANARDNVQDGYFPHKGDRVALMGRWVDDCGHPPFQTELHPISFLAWAHQEGDTTEADAYYSPYRETQLYNADPAKVVDVYNTARFNNLFSQPFPKGFVSMILALQGFNTIGPGIPTPDHLYSYGLLEANDTSPTDWVVCAPPGTAGTDLQVEYDFVARPGVEISATPDPSTGCATMHTVLGTQKTPDPTMRTCTVPWDFLDKIAAEEAGIPSIDIKAEISTFVGDPYKDKLDPDPTMDCYDPVVGPNAAADPVGQNVTVAPDVQAPFYGKVQVYWTTPEPPPSSTSSSTSSTSSSTSSTSSSSSTPGYPAATLAVSPATVAQGGTVTVTVGGFAANTAIRIELEDGTVLGSLTTDPGGQASGTFTIPGSVAAGVHQVRAVGPGADGKAVTLETPITVTTAAPDSSFTPSTRVATGSLPRTGAALVGPSVLALGLVAGGTGAIVAGRRRRRAAGSR